MINNRYQINPYLMSTLSNHLNQLSSKYSKLLPIRVDFGYRTYFSRWHQRNNDYSSCDIRRLMEKLMDRRLIVGYAWVMEHTPKHGIHFHTILYLNAQIYQKYYPIYQEVQDEWKSITQEQGMIHDCNRDKNQYEVKGLNTLSYDNHSQRKKLHFALSYLAKTAQKEQFIDINHIFDISYVEPPSGRGRPRIR